MVSFQDQAKTVPVKFCWGFSVRAAWLSISCPGLADSRMEENSNMQDIFSFLQHQSSLGIILHMSYMDGPILLILHQSYRSDAQYHPLLLHKLRQMTDVRVISQCSTDCCSHDTFMRGHLPSDPSVKFIRPYMQSGVAGHVGDIVFIFIENFPFLHP